MKTCKILIKDDPRYKYGEIGIVIENDSSKYDYFIELEGTIDTPFGKMKRQFYFYKDEIEIFAAHAAEE